MRAVRFTVSTAGGLPDAPGRITLFPNAGRPVSFSFRRAERAVLSSDAGPNVLVNTLSNVEPLGNGFVVPIGYSISALPGT